ncbi:1763_t:CDS:1 [Cetraspora pellucida]|uniref:1763_t:CDS:1 n=1 Tax=Cetraspora pellucida TaxID=1433469 RepID=A0A9N8ZL04_9GLOM|nr:1763_t:CDS:1 [Cetraspora pellucida]
MKLRRFVIIITLVTIAIGMLFPVYSIFLRNKLERSSSSMTFLTLSSMNKNKRDVDIDTSTGFDTKLIKKDVIAVSSNDSSSEEPSNFRPKKMSSEHSRDDDQPTYTSTKNVSSSSTPLPQPSVIVGTSDIDAQKLQEEEDTLHKIIVVLCSLGASLVLVAIAIAILFWKVRQQYTMNNNDQSRGGDKNIGINDKNMDDVQDKSDDGTNIGVTVVINDNIINNNLNADVYNVKEEYLDKKQLTMSQLTMPPYPSIYDLSIVPTAPSAEEIAPHNELPDAGASNFSTPPINSSDPPPYNFYGPSAPPLYSHPFGPIDSIYTAGNNYVIPSTFVGVSALPALNTGSNFVSDAPTMPEETHTPLSSMALTFSINTIDDDGNDISSFGPTHNQSTL